MDACASKLVFFKVGQAARYQLLGDPFIPCLSVRIPVVAFSLTGQLGARLCDFLRWGFWALCVLSCSVHTLIEKTRILIVGPKQLPYNLIYLSVIGTFTPAGVVAVHWGWLALAVHPVQAGKGNICTLQCNV